MADGLLGTHRHAGTAVDALLGLDVKRPGAFVDAVHGTLLDAGAVDAVDADGAPLTETVDEDGLDVVQPVLIDTYSPTVRYGNTEEIVLPEAGQHTIRLVNTGEKNPESAGNDLSIAGLKVLPPERVNSLPTILGMLFGL